MRMLLVLLFVVLATAGNVKPPPAPYAPECLINDEHAADDADPSKVPWFVVDLDAPADQRFRMIARTYKALIPPVLQNLQDMVKLIFGEAPVFELIESFFQAAYEGGRYPEPYRSEIKSIADEVGIPISQIAMMNVFYELSRYCTSIVAEADDGGMWHARNLDFGQLFIWDPSVDSWGLTEALKKITININFVKNGKILFKGTTFAGHTGIITGMKPGQFTLSMNAMMKSDLGQLFEWLTGDIRDVTFVMWATRIVMETTNSYDEAHNYLSTVPQLTGDYYILGGPKHGQGSVIIRNATGVAMERKLHDGVNDWFLLQTNYNPDQQPLWVDDRRTGGNACMNQLGSKNVNKKSIYKVLKSKTTLNKTTAHTVIMSLTDGVYETYIQSCPNPCWPF